jgi:superfamily II DNA helicase RecQ
MKERISADLQDPDGHLRLLLCTEAFSMGADPAMVKTVVHITPPSTIEGTLLHSGCNIFMMEVEQ